MLIEERLCLTADKKKVVKENDPKAAYLFATPGMTIPDALADKYGLLKKKKDKPDDKKKETPPNKLYGGNSNTEVKTEVSE